MNLRKPFMTMLGSFALVSTAFATEPQNIEPKEQGSLAVVNFATCLQGSKYGKQEQTHFENVRQQMVEMIEKTDKELKDLAGKIEDTAYMEGLSNEAKGELETKYKSLNQDLARYQSHYYQILQQTQMQSMQKINQKVTSIAAKIAEKKQLAYVLNKELCFYHNPKLDITDDVVKELDQEFEVEQAKELAKKEEEAQQ